MLPTGRGSSGTRPSWTRRPGRPGRSETRRRGAGGARRWVTTRPTCATSSSTCSRCSGAPGRARHRPVRRPRRRRPPARSCARSSGWRPRTSPTPSSTPTATRRSSTRRRHSVTMPESFKEVVPRLRRRRLADLDLPVELGGTPRPPSVRWAVAEMVLGSNPAVHMYSSGRGVRPRPLDASAPRSRSAGPRSAPTGSGAPRWCSPSRTPAPTSAPAAPKAVRQADGSWHIEGVKRFITSGRARPDRQHLPPGARPPRGRRPRHQGPVAVHRAEAPRRLGDRRAR